MFEMCCIYAQDLVYLLPYKLCAHIDKTGYLIKRLNVLDTKPFNHYYLLLSRQEMRAFA